MDRLISEQYLIEHLTACFENGRPMYRPALDEVLEMIKAIPSAKPKKCKDCKWWKDSDGVYRRGIRAESKCPINNVSVNHGLGYCYMFEVQESENKECQQKKLIVA